MFGAIKGAVSDLADDIKDKVGDLADGATDAAAALIGGEKVKPLLEAKEALSSLADSLSEPQKQLAKLSETAGGLPTESATAAGEQFSKLSSSFSDLVSGDAKKLVPPGMACIASYWADSVKAKLGAVSKEAEDMLGKVKGTPEKAMGELKGIQGSINAASGGLGEVASVVQDLVATLKGYVMSPSKLKELGTALDRVESSFAGSLSKARGSLEAVNNSVASTPGTVVSMVEGLSNNLETFMMRTPAKIVAAFKPPAPICCLGCGKVGEGKEKLEAGLNEVSSALDLLPMLEGVKGIKTTLDGMDLSAATNALNQVEEQFNSNMEKLKEAAKKITEATG